MNAIRQNELGVIQADLMSAEAIVTAYNANPSNPNMLCMAAYHLEQAIEKSLKAIVHAERPDIYNKTDGEGKVICKTTHSIDTLMTKAEICRNGITAAHKYIAENADTLGEFNNLRYGLKKIAEKDLVELTKAAKEIVQELEVEFEKANPDKEQNKQNAQHEWQSRRSVELTSGDAPHKSAIEKQIEAEEKARKERAARPQNGKKKKPYKPHNKNGSYGNNHKNRKQQQGRD